MILIFYNLMIYMIVNERRGVEFGVVAIEVNTTSMCRIFTIGNYNVIFSLEYIYIYGSQSPRNVATAATRSSSNSCCFIICITQVPELASLTPMHLGTRVNNETATVNGTYWDVSRFIFLGRSKNQIYTYIYMYIPKAVNHLLLGCFSAQKNYLGNAHESDVVCMCVFYEN